MVSASPNEVHVYDPISQNDQIIPLGFAPNSVSVSPDGQFAGVGHDGQFSYVDLKALAVKSVIPLDMIVGAVVLDGNGYAYVFANLGTSDYTIQLSNGTLSSWNVNNSLVVATLVGTARLSRDGSSIYYLTAYSGERYDISNPTLPTTGDLGSVGGPNFWLSEDGTRMITSGGMAYFTSPVATQDFGSDGSLSGANSVAWADNSNTQHQTAVLLGDNIIGAATGTQLQIYGDTGLSLESQIALPSFTEGGSSYIAHGRFVFWNSAETKIFVFTEADSSSGLLSDYGEYTVAAPGSLPACSWIASPTTLTVGPGFSANAFVGVTSACSWSYSVPNGSWISILGPGFESPIAGNGQVTLEVNQNTGAARSQTVTIAGETVTINQTASSCSYTLSSASDGFGQTGGSGSVGLTTDAGCGWTVQSNASWITVTSAQSGTGPATITYTVAPLPSGQTYQFSEITVAGTAALGVIQRYGGGPLSFVPVNPCRVVDTRIGTGAFGGPFLGANSTRSFTVPSSSCNIPASAQAYSVNVTVVPHKSLSYLTVFPTGYAQPYVSTINSDGRIKAVAAIVPAGTGGAISFYATDDTELVLDINGYFTTDTSTSLLFYPLTPCRISDTRDATATFGGPSLTAMQTRDFPILSSSCNVPAAAQAYSLNYTVVPKDNPISYISTWPVGETMPVVSTLNDFKATVIANAAIVPAGTKGDVNVYSTDATDLVIDINGYFGAAGGGGLHFYPVTPCRMLDTRSTTPLNGTMNIGSATSVCGVPATASAVVVNATVVPANGLSYLTFWPTGSAQPVVSTLNDDDSSITSNMAIIPMGNGSITAFATNTTQLILDVSGYFAP